MNAELGADASDARHCAAPRRAAGSCMQGSGRPAIGARRPQQLSVTTFAYSIASMKEDARVSIQEIAVSNLD